MRGRVRTASPTRTRRHFRARDETRVVGAASHWTHGVIGNDGPNRRGNSVTLLSS